ncbi:hypothetical protein SLS55_000256 [Diplodia seriata]|uniref:Uncharacterized protein n=1 Tax=Diplodia seriata TaxID=420778 RepID=A0ABR3CTR9_9PEZI
MTPIQQRHSQILTHPAPSAFRRDTGTIMRTWLGTAVPGEFRKNNNCLKASAGTIAHMGRQRLNLSAPYWAWLMSQEAPLTLATTSDGALARRAVLCDEQHNREAHSADGAHFVCPHPHPLDDAARWDHSYEHIVCAACEVAQPRACSPLVRMVLVEGPLVAMCEGCALGALQRLGPGHNGCRCSRGAYGGMCLRHQNEEGEQIARRWLAYRARHHGPGGWDERVGGQVVVPYCRCGRVPVPRGWRPWAFWCAACEGPVMMPRMGEGWRGGRRPQRWLVVGNLPVVDYDAAWMRSPSSAPSYRQGGPVVDPDRFRGARGQSAGVGSAQAPSGVGSARVPSGVGSAQAPSGVGPARAPSGGQRPSSMAVVPPWRRPPSVDLNNVDDDDYDDE